MFPSFFIPKKNKVPVSINAKKSANGAAYRSPPKPHILGNTIIAGISKINCLVNDKKIDVLGLPIAWKKLDATNWKPTTGKHKNHALI